MPGNPLRELEDCGQSVWIDFIDRDFVKNGGLEKLVREDDVRGVTSNPTIFEKAISGSADYDDELRELARRNASVEETFQTVASTDIGMAADVLRPVYDRTGRKDGFVSIEVSPDAAHDTAKTMQDAHFFWSTIDRPNIMIKVPATPEGIPAIRQLISEGINVNITLIFAVSVYEEVMEAFLQGLQDRAGAGHDISHVSSVASFFVSRVDTLVDKLIDQKLQGATGDQRTELEALLGKAAVANAKIAYERFEAVFGSERGRALLDQGAQLQRPLWASTSTKNPKYPDTFYVDNLAGPHSVNTMPLQTVDAVRNHGTVRCNAIQQGVDEAHQVFERLSRAGIDMKEVTDELTVDGVKKFADSLHQLYRGVQQKLEQLRMEEQGAAVGASGGQ